MSALAIEGYASLWWKKDFGDDVVAPGAFDAAADRPAARVKMLHQHDAAVPVGVWDEVRPDARGLYVRGRILPEAPVARMCAALVRAGALDGLSIGFRTLRARADPGARLRVLEAVDLWEVSLVTFPMLREARLNLIPDPKERT
ncbi:MAG: HK97 family phage prohead protease [Caulobacteraceae bacterium]|nr:HK97 family phage prohead protease [Caulobacter sp.]